MNKVCSHEIQIKNLETGEIINHSILLIKGTLRRPCTSGLVITLEIIDNINRKRQFQTVSIGRKHNFKTLVDLREFPATVEVEFLFSYCNSQHHIKCYYEVPDHSYYRLQPLYILCKDEKDRFCNEEALHKSVKETCDLIDLNLLLVQCLYAEKLREHGFGRLSFKLNDHCQIFQSGLTCEEAWNSSEDDLWLRFGKEILNCSLGEDKRLKFVAFIACTKYDGALLPSEGEDFSYANIRRNLKGHAALGGGGLALFGSAYFYAWPKEFLEIDNCFRNECRVDVTKLPDDSNYRRTYAGVYATSLGAVCHELGHIFDLGHTDGGIMGTDFDYLNRVFAVDPLTEHLPKREVEINKRENRLPTSASLMRPRFTNFRSQDTFLQKYHEQKQSDGCNFTRNCAVILAHHCWIRVQNNNKRHLEHIMEPEFDPASQIIFSKDDALKLIEFRRKSNSMVDSFYELMIDADNEPVYQFVLTPYDIKLINTHYIFVITVNGHVKTFNFTENGTEKQ